MGYAQLVFSPTGGTMKVAQAISSAWTGETASIDLTDGAVDFAQYAFQADDLVLIALPSYGGRVPALAADRLSEVQGNGAKCVLLCVYGNRAYEDTLIEMRDIAQQCGFCVLAAIAAVAEHSIMHQYAAGRPDTADIGTLQGFGEKVLQKFCSGDRQLPAIPGNQPYKKAGSGGLVPQGGKTCVDCGQCAEQCPAQAIPRDDPRKTDGKKCISCMRCVVRCPNGARKVNGAMVSVAALAIKKACSVRKECELYL